MMTRKDGVELILELMSLDPDTRIIAVSGKGETGLRFATYAGARRIIRKPIDPEVLIRSVRELLDLESA